MTQQIKLAPCPFCEGPPCTTIKNFLTDELVGNDHPQTADFSEDYEAHVWCHECGAQGPRVDSCDLGSYYGLFDLTADCVMRVAADRWNDRNAKARQQYDAGDEAGLNLYPRPDEIKEPV